MTLLKSFLRLSLKELRLAMSAALLVEVIVIGLRLFSSRLLRRAVSRAIRPASGIRQFADRESEQIVQAVLRSSSYMPRATCLSRALAAHVLLRRRGYPARLRIGVQTRAAQPFQAHAWVEINGTVVIGGPDVSYFEVMASPP